MANKALQVSDQEPGGQLNKYVVLVLGGVGCPSPVGLGYSRTLIHFPTATDRYTIEPSIVACT